MAFQTNATQALYNANDGRRKKIHLWTSSLTDLISIADDIPIEDYVIQSWADSDQAATPALINEGYNVVMSPADRWYFDCGTGSWAANNYTLPCHPYNQWREMYDYDPAQNYLSFPGSDPGRLDQILGGEACAFSETIGADTLEARVWPRGSALAERLWTNPQGSDWVPAELRFVHQRERMVERGIQSAAANMHWCHQFEDQCRLLDWKFTGNVSDVPPSIILERFEI